MLPRPSSRSASRTRAHSVTTWRARRRSTGSAIPLRSPSSQLAERPADEVGGPFALGAPRGVGRAAEQAGDLAVHDDERRVGGNGDRTGLEAGEVDVQGVAGGGGGDRQRIEQTHVRPRAALGLLAVAGERQWVEVMAEREQEGDREGGARGQARPDRERAGHPDAAAAGRSVEPQEPGRQGGLGRNRGGVTRGDLHRLVGELVRVDPDQEAAGPGREGDLGREVDGHGEGEPSVVVRVVADDGHSSRGAGRRHLPSLAQAGRLDRRRRLGSRSCGDRPQRTVEWDQDRRAGGDRAGALHLHDARRRRRPGPAPRACRARGGRARRGGAGVGCGAALGPVEPVPAVGRHRLEESGRRRARARPGRAGRRVDRRVPARCGRAVGGRARDLPGPQPQARLRTHDGLGPGRTAGLDGRTRHRLHRHRGRAVVARPGRLGAGAPAEPGR